MAGKLRYKTVEAFAAAVDEYFEKCKGEILTEPTEGEKEKPVLDKWGKPVIINAHPPSIPGLALHLGFAGKSGLVNYKFRRGYETIYQQAVTKCEEYAYGRLFDRDGARGAAFALEYAFGYGKEKEEQKEPVRIIDDIPKIE